MIDLDQILSPGTLKKYDIVDWGYTQEAKASSFKHFSKWIEEGKHEPLGYLSGERGEKRKSVKDFFPEFQSALVFLFSYAPFQQELNEFYRSSESNGLKMASYALGQEGEDYHHKIRRSLEDLAKLFKDQDDELQVMHTLDIQPVLDRDLAYRGGLGWYGKNSMLISREYGSYTLIGSLLLSKEISTSQKKLEVDHCGQCTACIEACPTEAIDIENRTIISNKCISTYTIEVFKDDVMEAPKGMKNGGGEIFGCDICQDVCPWNQRLERFIKERKILNPVKGSRLEKLVNFFLKRDKSEVIADLESMSNKGFRRDFKDTALERTGRIGLLKNIKVYLD